MSSSSVSENAIWSQPKKIAFRFFFSYFSLVILFMNNGAYPFYNFISELYNSVLYKFIPWVGKTILGIDYKIVTGPNGSGDTTYDYVLLFTIFSVAIIATIIWTLLDRKSTNYKKMYYWLSLGIRAYVGLMLINYGMVKVIQLQFSQPSMYRLTETFGESSPMGLAWTFLGFSKGYNMFMGIAEILAGLLLFRRTLTFGLIITLMASANVMAVNYFFDVPVKILSTHLVAMSLFLLMYNFKELLQFFFTKTPVSLSIIEKPKFSKMVNKVLIGLKVLVLLYALPYAFNETLRSREKYKGEATKSYLKGFYEVKEFKVNDSLITKNTDEITKWKYLMIDRKNYLLTMDSNNRRNWLKFTADSLKNEISLQDRRDTLKIYKFNYTENDSLFYLNGTIKKDTISNKVDIKFKRTKDFRKRFLLTNRGFHWISERPFNR